MIAGYDRSLYLVVMAAPELMREEVVVPIPKPKKTEDHKSFMGRCVPTLRDEYKRDQAVAICLKQWGNEPISDVGKTKRKKR